jgi:carbamoylphosphate synthase large subunit
MTIAAKLAVGYLLDELKNDITRESRVLLSFRAEH